MNTNDKDKILRIFEEGKVRDEWGYYQIQGDWDGFVKRLEKAITETEEVIRKEMYDYYFKGLKEPIIVEKSEQEKLIVEIPSEENNDENM